jgi:hypothetical protein
MSGRSFLFWGWGLAFTFNAIVFFRFLSSGVLRLAWF